MRGRGEQQIPFGNDKKKDKGNDNCKSNCKGKSRSFAALRMTTFAVPDDNQFVEDDDICCSR
jgi:hypothetical protein